ncbi:MAG: flavin reductase family protein [Ruminococcaceae bacterium]|nr:flavin reductase family protein [Oscillospiraceae bacterium]
MSKWFEISPEQIETNAFSMIGKDWMLIAAEKEGKTNAMTASWGGIGVLWNKPVSFCFIRPQRYTKEFIDASERFSLTFFTEEYRKTLSYFGRVSGRDEDKIEKAGLSVEHAEGAPYFREGNLVLLCKKLYVDTIKPEGILSPEIVQEMYPGADFHSVYIGEIVKAFMKAE